MKISDFGLKIGIEGEKEFKNALRDTNQSFKVFGSEMNLLPSEFDNNDRSIQAITASNQDAQSGQCGKAWSGICGYNACTVVIVDQHSSFETYFG